MTQTLLSTDNASIEHEIKSALLEVNAVLQLAKDIIYNFNVDSTVKESVFSFLITVQELLLDSQRYFAKSFEEQKKNEIANEINNRQQQEDKVIRNLQEDYNAGKKSLSDCEKEFEAQLSRRKK
jgi:hypothetical protein